MSDELFYLPEVDSQHNTSGTEGVDYQPERNIAGDVSSSLWRGTGSALDVYGTGLDSQWMQDFGKFILGTDFAKQDESQYKGTNSEANKILSGAAESLPTSSVIGAATIGGATLGSAAGPVGSYAGGAAGLSAAGTVLWKGLRSKAFDEIIAKDPNISTEDAGKYADISATIEAGTEGVGALVDVATAKLGGKLVSGALKDALRYELFSAKEAIGSVAKRGTIAELTGKVVGSSTMEGGEEVLADKLHYEEDKAYGLNPNAPDYFKTFMIGAVAGLPTIAAANIVEQKSQARISANIEAGLTSENVEQRRYTADQILETLAKASPEAAERWGAYVDVNVDKGPLDLKSPILSDITAQAEWKKKYNETIYTQITKDPSSILEEAGIPTSEYGNAKAPEGSEVRDNLLSRIQDTPELLANQNTNTKGVTGAYNDPINARKIENLKTNQEAIAALPEDSNNVAIVAETEKKPVPVAKNEEFKAKVLADIASAPMSQSKAQWQTDPEMIRKQKVEEQARSWEAEGFSSSETSDVPTTPPPLPTNLKERQAAKVKAVAPVVEPVVTTTNLKGEKVTKAPEVKVEEKPVAVNEVKANGEVTKVSYPADKWVQHTAGVSVYQNDNAIIAKSGKKWQAFQKDEVNPNHPEESVRVPLGEFKSLSDAQRALSQGKDSTEFYGEKEEARAVPLTLKEKHLLSTIDTEEVARVAVAKSNYNTDPAAHGAAVDGILKAAKDFNPDKGATFKSYATGRAMFAIKDYGKTLIADKNVMTQESSTEVSEGSEREGRIANTSKEEVLDALDNGPIKVQKEKRPEPSPVKKIELTQEEKDAYNKSLAEKKKPVPKDVIDYQKLLDEEIPMDKETDSDVDESPTVIRRPSKVKGVSVSDLEALFSDKAQDILDRNNGDKTKAKALADTLSDESAATMLKDAIDAINSKIDASRRTTVGKILEQFLTKEHENTSKGKVAKFLDKLVKDADKADLEVLIDPDSQTEHYSSKNDRIVLRGDGGRNSTYLHEIVHAITTRALSNSKELTAKVRKVMDAFEDHIVADPSIPITAKDIFRMRKSGNTSRSFKKEFSPLEFGEHRDLMYALLNEHEFLAQHTSSPMVQEISQLVEVPTGLIEKLKSAYESVVGFMLEAFGRPKIFHNAMKSTMELLVEISQSQRGVLAAEVDTVNESSDVKEKPKTPRTYSEKLAVLRSNDTKGKPVDIIREFSKKVKSGLKDYGKVLSEALREINPKLTEFVRRFEYSISKYNVKYHDEVKDFIDKYKKMNRDDQLLLDLVLMNRNEADVAKRDEILKKNKMTDSYLKVVKVLEDIHRRKENVALNKFEAKPDYFPRAVKDLQGLMQTMKGDPSYGVIQAELDRVGGSKADQEKAVMDMMNTGRYPALALLEPSSSKRRVIAKVTPEWSKYYHSSIDSLINHIYESNEAIEARNMFGDVKRGALTGERDTLMQELIDNKKLTRGQREKMVGKINLIEEKLDNYEEEWKDGISSLMVKEGINLDSYQQTEVIKLIRGRLTQKGMHGIGAHIRNLSLMSTLGTFTSTLTQLTDNVFSVQDNGVINTLKGVFGKNIVTTSDLDLSNSMREFQSTGTSKFLDKLLRGTGLIAMDMFGKHTYMNATIEKAKSMTLEQFTKKWGDSLGKDVKETYEAIKSGEKNELTKFFAFTTLSDVQPVSLSETPLKYLTSGNGRIFYALKTYSIKAINTFYKRSVYDFRTAKTNGEKAKALANAGKLIALMALAGAGTDELKDLILGRDVDFGDNVTSNLLKIVMLNKYTMTKGGGIAKNILADTLLPPTKLIDDPYTDIVNLFSGEKEATFKTLNSLPHGNILYSQLTDAGKKSSKEMLKRDILSDARGGATMGDLREKISIYNQWARGAKEPLITYQTIHNAKKKKKK